MIWSQDNAIVVPFGDEASSGAAVVEIGCPLRGRLLGFKVCCENLSSSGTVKIFNHPDAIDLEDTDPLKAAYTVATLTVTSGRHVAALDIPYFVQGGSNRERTAKLYALLSLDEVGDVILNPLFEQSGLAN